MIQSTHEQVRKTVHFYVKKKWPFTYEIQNETISIKSKYGSYGTRNKDYTIDDINFIKAVKTYIIKNNLQEQYRPSGRRKPVMYFKYNGRLKPGEILTDVINIDLSSAYWETANKLGLLSKELYKQGKEVRKQVRLAAIGSLAKKKKVYEFDGHKQKLISVINSERTEFLWDVICTEVGAILENAAKEAGNKFVFFWVDGIYVRGGAEASIERFFKKAGYAYKTSPLKSVEVTPRNIFITTHDDPKAKPFPFRNKKLNP